MTFTSSIRAEAGTGGGAGGSAAGDTAIGAAAGGAAAGRAAGAAGKDAAGKDAAGKDAAGKDAAGNTGSEAAPASTGIVKTVPHWLHFALRPALSAPTCNTWLQAKH